MTGVNDLTPKISPQNVKKMNQRSQRPTSSHKKATSKSKVRANVEEAAVDEVEGDMANTFLQYCATCEKQIEHPNSGILYCSEACRRKDTVKPLCLSMNAMTTTESSSSRPTTPSTKPRVILQPLTPTAPFSTSTPDKRIPPDLHDFQPDLDPTEWKPKPARRPATPSHETEAYRYLSQFHRTNFRPAYHRSATSLSNAILTATTTPSLASTTSTAASSMDSSFSYPYALEFNNTRPILSPPNNELFLSGTTKSADLVTPIAPPPPGEAVTATSLPDCDLMGATWEKKTVIPGKSEGHENLRKLFEGAASAKGGV
ncbi:MAG: hypothetical protein Q9227_007823 [Pyrenula ochraceoflavens]